MFRSLRATLLVASVLWTMGLLALMHMLSMGIISVFPAMTKLRHNIVVVFGFALMIAGVVCLRSGLKRFKRLRDEVVAVRAHSANRVEGPYPSELRPLIEDLNALLDEREKAVGRAVAGAGDLAHGLKTPLALLRREADRARGAGQVETADSIDREVERMSRQVEYHLARARAAASGAKGAAPVPLAATLDAVGRTVLKMHESRDISLEVVVASDLSVRVQPEDLEEILGNVLDNACKWARHSISVRAIQGGGAVHVVIDDDGPGIPEAERSAALGRGVRLDEAAPGSGLGLAIVRDLVETYGGSVGLDTAPAGGLRVRLSLPSGGPIPPAAE